MIGTPWLYPHWFLFGNQIVVNRRHSSTFSEENLDENRPKITADRGIVVSLRAKVLPVVNWKRRVDRAICSNSRRSGRAISAVVRDTFEPSARALDIEQVPLLLDWLCPAFVWLTFATRPADGSSSADLSIGTTTTEESSQSKITTTTNTNVGPVPNEFAEREEKIKPNPMTVETKKRRTYRICCLSSSELLTNIGASNIEPISRNEL